MANPENEVRPCQQSDSLLGKSLRALKWNYIGVAARICMQFVAQIALARLLGPEAFGVIAALLLIMAVSNLLAEMGLGAALVQTKDLDDRQVRAVFGRLLLSAAVVSTILFLMKGWLADFFGSPLLSEVLPWVLPAFVLQAATVVSQALLRRQLDFKSIQSAQILGYGVGYLLVGVSFAWFGLGVWSLVAAWTVQNAIGVLMMYAKSRHSLRPCLQADLRKEQKFGFSVLFTNLANWVIENIDNLMVGRFFGTAALGTYAVAYNLVRTPANHLVVSIQQVIFPLTARTQDEPEKQRAAYLAALWVVSMLALPIFLGCAVVAPTVVQALYGPAWNSAGPVLQALSCAMALHAVMAIAGPVLWGRGEARQEFKVQFVTAALLVLCLIWAAGQSVQALAWVVCAVYLLRAVWMHWKVAVLLELSAGRLIKGLAPSCLLAGFVCVVLWAVDQLLSRAVTSAGLHLVADMLVAAGMFVLAIYIGGRKWLPVELHSGLPVISARLPRWLAKRFMPSIE